MTNEALKARDIKSDPSNPDWRFRNVVWDLIVAHIDDLEVGETRSALEDVVFEYYDHCGAGRQDT